MTEKIDPRKQFWGGAELPGKGDPEVRRIRAFAALRYFQTNDIYANWESVRSPRPPGWCGVG